MKDRDAREQPPHPGRAARGPFVEIWLADLSAAARALKALEAHAPRLTVADRARLALAVGERIEDERALAHVVLRLLIERAFGSSWRGVDYGLFPSGKLSLDGLEGDFSLAHTAGRALIGIARPGPIGVDLETRREPALPAERRARIEAAAASLAPDASLPADEPDRLLQAWVRLEAAGKADGRGVGHVLGVTGAWGDPGTRKDAGAARLPLPFDIHDVAVEESFFAAIAVPAGTAGPFTIERLPNDLDTLAGLASPRP